MLYCNAKSKFRTITQLCTMENFSFSLIFIRFLYINDTARFTYQSFRQQTKFSSNRKDALGMKFFGIFVIIIGVCVTLAVSSLGAPPPPQKCDCNCPLNEYTKSNPNCGCPACESCDCFCPPKAVSKQCEVVCEAQGCGDVHRH